MPSLAQALGLLARLRWFNCAVIFFSPLLALYGVLSAPSPPHRSTLVFAWAYYVFNMLGITAGYHRLWSHRSYTAHPILQFLLASAGSGAVQGSIRWWARTHRIHHRYTDTDLDPYNAKWGLWWTHVGWMLVRSPSFEEKVERERVRRQEVEREKNGVGKARVRIARVDVSDLDQNWIVRMQHEWYFLVAIFWGALVPVCAVGLLSGRWREGLVWAGLVRLVCVHHCTFAVNSLAHHLGHSPYPHPPPRPHHTTNENMHLSHTSTPATSNPLPHAPFPRPHPTARNHLLTAILTLGEGYHAFHHAFPCDYRCAEDWWGFDPTKWMVAALAGDFAGLGEVGRCAGEWVGNLVGLGGGDGGESGEIGRQLVKWMGVDATKFGFDLRRWALVRDRRVFEVKTWVGDVTDTNSVSGPNGLEEWTWEEYKSMSRTHSLVLVAGFIHDVRALLGEVEFGSDGSAESAGSGSLSSNGTPGPNSDIGKEEAITSSLVGAGLSDATKASHLSLYRPSTKSHNPDPDPNPKHQHQFTPRTYRIPTHLPSYPHPGGLALLRHAIGTDATTAFFGGVYEHGWGAHEMLAKMRVAILKNGYEHVGEGEKDEL